MKSLTLSEIAPTSSIKYTKKNAYTKRASIQQITTLILFLSHITLHSIFIVPSLIEINKIWLYLFLAIFYAMFVGVLVDYMILTISDPVDPLIQSDQNFYAYKIKYAEYKKLKQESSHYYQRRQNPYAVIFCSKCQRYCLKKSYHCWTCDRCVSDMDHHCKYLNNCIGGKNYQYFFRLLLFATFYLIFGFIHCLWTFLEIESVGNRYSQDRIKLLEVRKWMGLALLIYSLILLISVDILLGFHIKLNFMRNMTTIQYLMRSTPSNDSGYQSEHNILEL